MNTIRISRFYSFLCVTALALLLTSCAGSPSRTSGGTDMIYNTVGTPSYMRGDVYHNVAPGETLWRVAKMYDVDLKTLKRVNNISDVKDVEIGTSLYVPDAAPRKHVITLYPSRKWKYIIIHHSATEEGNSMEFNKAHLKRGWKGVGYHFVIDNGTCGKSNGQIETSPRWIKQMNGAHCKADGMNKKGIGICLVGNYSKDNLSQKQLDSLVYLVSTLQEYYNIPDSRIMGHGQVPGAATECPGKKFPWARFRTSLR